MACLIDVNQVLVGVHASYWRERRQELGSRRFRAALFSAFAFADRLLMILSSACPLSASAKHAAASHALSAALQADLLSYFAASQTTFAVDSRSSYRRSIAILSLLLQPKLNSLNSQPKRAREDWARRARALNSAVVSLSSFSISLSILSIRPWGLRWL